MHISGNFIRIPAIMPITVQPVQPLHITVFQLKSKTVHVICNVLWIRGFGEDTDALLCSPPDRKRFK